MANTALVLGGDLGQIVSQNYSLGIALGLVAGKPFGISLLTFAAVSLGICKLPDGLNWKSVVGIGFLGGIGFTMSIFIALLAFSDENIINNAKVIILFSSLLAGLVGFLLLKVVLKKKYL